eukprot:756236-Hanusia_phi.AAC.1
MPAGNSGTSVIRRSREALSRLVTRHCGSEIPGLHPAPGGSAVGLTGYTGRLDSEVLNDSNRVSATTLKNRKRLLLVTKRLLGAAGWPRLIMITNDGDDDGGPRIPYSAAGQPFTPGRK